VSDIRRYRPGDEDALVQVCVRTADAGGDATGLLPDDRLWADLFVLPYVARHPELAFVVAAEDGRVTGYVVGAPDTAVFEAWFRDHWWPEHEARYAAEATGAEGSADGVPALGPRDQEAGRRRRDDLLRYAAGRGRASRSDAAAYPAHLHIDLLPELQGQGWGRRLIETLLDALREAGVPGVHLVAGEDNAGALAFYPRVGFAPLPSEPGSRAFGRTL